MCTLFSPSFGGLIVNSALTIKLLQQGGNNFINKTTRVLNYGTNCYNVNGKKITRDKMRENYRRMWEKCKCKLLLLLFFFC